MSLVTEAQAYKGVKCRPIILLFEEGIVTEDTHLTPSTKTIEVLKAEEHKFIAVVLAVDSQSRPRMDARPLAGMLRAMPRELWYVSWLEIAGKPKAIVVHRGIEGEALKELYQTYDRRANQRKGKNSQMYGKLTHTVDIDLLIINPELWERITQAMQEGA